MAHQQCDSFVFYGDKRLFFLLIFAEKCYRGSDERGADSGESFTATSENEPL